MGYRCWNEEAMRGMNADAPVVWNTFAGDLITLLEHTQTSVNEIFDSATEITKVAGTYRLFPCCLCAIKLG
jgi:hypothetical protein